jgi:hypothetical protein
VVKLWQRLQHAIVFSMDLIAKKSKQLYGSIFFFPAALLLLVVILALFRISGSSVGAYNQILFGGTTTDKNLLFGKPQMIRSDEWLVNTPDIVSQSHFGYPKINPSIGTGEDTSVILDIPSRDWSEIFRPENWSFFVMPLEQAFAFKWWIVAWLLITSGYFFVLSLLPRKRMLASLLSIAFFLSPFFQWWYQDETFAPIYCSLFAILVFGQILKSTETGKRLMWTGLLGYVLTCFALVLYPPFQIPCGLVVAAVCLGMLFESKKLRLQEMRAPILYTLGGILLAGCMLALFFVSHKGTIHLIENTAYPGHRSVSTGGYSLTHILDGVFDREIQFYQHATAYIDNQSEESNFILLWPFLAIPLIFASVQQWVKKRKLDYSRIFVMLLLALFLAVLLLPVPEIISKVFLLDMVPQNRLIIGVGLINFILIAMFIKQIEVKELPRRWAIDLSIFAVLAELIVAYMIVRHHPAFLTSVKVIVFCVAVFGAIVFLFLRRRILLAAGLLLAFSLWSTYLSNPLYIGLGQLTSSKIRTEALQMPNARQSAWVFVGSIQYLNLLPAYGLRSYSATYMYPQPQVIHKFDFPVKDSFIYNRYAHVNFDPSRSGLVLDAKDTYSVGYSPCAPVYKKQIKYILSESKLTGSCVNLKTTVSYPYAFFYIYEVK